MSADLLDVQDDLYIARDFVRCAFLACEHGSPVDAKGAAVCAVLEAAVTRLDVIAGKIDALRIEQLGADRAD